VAEGTGAEQVDACTGFVSTEIHSQHRDFAVHEGVEGRKVAEGFTEIAEGHHVGWHFADCTGKCEADHDEHTGR
jgi:hypothetical protein